MKLNLSHHKPISVKAPEYPRGQANQLDKAMTYMIEQIAQRYRTQVFGAMHVSTVKKFADEDLMLMAKHVRYEEFDREIKYLRDSSGFEYDLYDDRAPEDCEIIRETKKDFRTVYDVRYTKVKLSSFADAQTGNYATVYLKLAAAAQKKLLKQFDGNRIKKVVRKSLEQVDSRNKEELYKRIEKKIGISTAALTQAEALKSTTNAYMIETEQWAKKLRDDTMEFFTSNSLRAMSLGQSLEDVMSQFDGLVEKRKGHAKMVARTQVATFNSLMTKTRAQNLGLKKAIWITAGDERVRPCHQVRDGKEFELSKGLYADCDGKTLLPGIDFNCRCDYEILIPEEEEIAPEVEEIDT